MQFFCVCSVFLSLHLGGGEAKGTRTGGNGDGGGEACLIQWCAGLFVKDGSRLVHTHLPGGLVEGGAGVWIEFGIFGGGL